MAVAPPPAAPIADIPEAKQPSEAERQELLHRAIIEFEDWDEDIRSAWLDEVYAAIGSAVDCTGSVWGTVINVQGHRDD